MMTLQFAVPRVGSFLLCGPCPSFTPAYHGSRPRELGATTIMPYSSLFWLNETNEWMSEADKAAWVMLLRIPLEMNYSMKEIYSTRSSWAICPHIVLKSHLQTEQRWQQWRFSSWWCPRGALDTSAGGKNCKGQGRDHHLLQNSAGLLGPKFYSDCQVQTSLESKLCEVKNLICFVHCCVPSAWNYVWPIVFTQ